MKKIIFIVLLVTLLAMTFALSATAGDEKVAICHVDGQGRTLPLIVSPNAMPAHLAHGDYGFAGDWGHGVVLNPPNRFTLTRQGNVISGHWNIGPRPDFSGTLVNGCVVDMVFPDYPNLTYRGTLVSECRLQWSYPNHLTTVDPSNFWIMNNCPS